MTRKSFPLNFLHLIVTYICILLGSIMKTLVYDGTDAEHQLARLKRFSSITVTIFDGHSQSGSAHFSPKLCDTVLRGFSQSKHFLSNCYILY